MFKITVRAFFGIKPSIWLPNVDGAKMVSRGKRKSSCCSFKVKVGVTEQRGRVIGTATASSPKDLKKKKKGRILLSYIQAAQSTWSSFTFCEENGKRTATPVHQLTPRTRAKLLLSTCKRLSLVRW